MYDVSSIYSSRDWLCIGVYDGWMYKGVIVAIEIIWISFIACNFEGLKIFLIWCTIRRNQIQQRWKWAFKNWNWSKNEKD